MGGEAPAEPKRQRMASSEWRIVLEGSASALPKIFGASGDVSSSFANLWRVGLLPDRLKNFLGAAGDVPPIFRRMNSALIKSSSTTG